MNLKIEEIFVENFIVKEYKSRVLYELNSSKKREKALSRFSHEAINILQPERIVLKSHQLSYNDVKNYLSGNESCYIIGGNIDKSIKKIKNCFDECINNPLSLVIICENGLVIVKEELTLGSPMKYVMYFENRNLKHLMCFT